MDFLFRVLEKRAGARPEARQENGRKRGTVGCLPQRPKRNSRDGCDRHRARRRPEGRQGGGIFVDAHRAEICNSAGGTLRRLGYSETRIRMGVERWKTFRVSYRQVPVYDDGMSELLEVRGLTVEL